VFLGRLRKYKGVQILLRAMPLVRKKIPVHVLNSFKPELQGTLITAEALPCSNPVKSIACKKGITIVNVTSTRI
jgi:aspartate kinase